MAIREGFTLYPGAACHRLPCPLHDDENADHDQSCHANKKRNRQIKKQERQEVSFSSLYPLILDSEHNHSNNQTLHNLFNRYVYALQHESMDTTQ
jgi:hypothetical protein